MQDCDVVIVNYSAGKLLIDCVWSTIAEGARRVIVVDNDSQDESLAYLENSISDDRVSIIRNTKNLGFAAACNIGARASNADTVLFLNPDSMLAPGALRRMVEVLESDPLIGMVGGLLCNPDGSEQPGGRRVIPTPRRAFVRAFGLSHLGKWFPSLFSDFLLHKEPLPLAPTPVEAISGACMLIKRQALENVGLWDEGYFLHCEDLDWCMRFRLNNWRVVFVPDARVIHVWGACSRSRPFFVEWHKHKGMVRFYRKFFRHQYPLGLMGLVSLGVWLRFGLVCTYHAANFVRGRFER
ncbi:MAG: glycosyltransferase family 2 protein [Aequoribacter sp.]|uniref:glycosyltransferase family 2 protein n=1 Tax=Aequoribacter sp. TaxID=2847771 RepID=UPI003C5701EE